MIVRETELNFWGKEVTDKKNSPGSAQYCEFLLKVKKYVENLIRKLKKYSFWEFKMEINLF